MVSIYATARDAQITSRTDIAFIETQPFERNYTQSQQGGGMRGMPADGAGSEPKFPGARKKSSPRPGTKSAAAPRTKSIRPRTRNSWPTVRPN